MKASRKTLYAAVAAVVAVALIAITALATVLLTRNPAPASNGEVSTIPGSASASVSPLDAKRQTCEGYYALQAALDSTPLVGINPETIRTNPSGVEHSVQVWTSANNAFEQTIDDRAGAVAESARQLVSATRTNITARKQSDIAAQTRSDAEFVAAKTSLNILCAPYKK